jgi:hypothetical protein
MVETRSVKVGHHQGDEVVCLAGPTKGTMTLAFGTAVCRSCESVSMALPFLLFMRWQMLLGLSCEGDSKTAT